MQRNSDEKDILFRTFAEITSLISLGKDNRIIFNKIVNDALDVLPAKKVYLIYVENRKIIKYAAEVVERGRKISVEDMPESKGILDWLHREVKMNNRREGVFALDLSVLANECMPEEDKVGMVISAPLMAKSSLFGIILAIIDQEKNTFSENDIHLLTIMANQAAIAFENYLLYKKLEMESITDGLTGIYNYRFLIRSLKLEMKRALRFNNVFSFIMLDVDNLKEYNDRNGHLSGSRALTQIAGILLKCCRDIDIISKYGGDEFGLLLPQTGVEGAVILARRILEAVRLFKFDDKQDGLLTCSIGISVFPDDAGGVEQIIERADAALYRAKAEGKNTIKSYGEMNCVERI
ncbi:MAG: sensor domain-containing diguanylate cyclase [Candidatus Krumholzibacteriota bacterium]|nr:sensor domain-containing diguanylate cyclase [Candidatus Krumholzibacteriota bacterium]